MKFIDLTGERFGMLTVMERTENRGTTTMWLCQCDCGNSSVVSSQNIRLGRTKSCGCQLVKHGQKGTRLYNIWGGMKSRCYRKSHKWYERYGGRGITICEEWLHNFQAFYDWAIKNGYEEGLSIDRIDNDKNYEPSNCKWSNQTDQIRNRSIAISVNINGIEKSLEELAEETGIPYMALYKRHKKGVCGIDLVKPIDKKKQTRKYRNACEDLKRMDVPVDMDGES